MRAKHINVFIKSAMDIFQKTLGIDLLRTDIVKQDSPFPNKNMSVIIGINGFMRGQVVYSMDSNFTSHLAHTLLPNILPLEIRKMKNSSIRKLAMMITENASLALSSNVNQLVLSPPIVMTAEDENLPLLQIPTTRVIFLSTVGEIEMNIALIKERRYQNKHSGPVEAAHNTYIV